MLVIIAGLTLFLTPFLGIPTAWKFHLVSTIGLLLILIGYRLRYRRAVRELQADTKESTDVFVEATPPLFDQAKSSE